MLGLSGFRRATVWLVWGLWAVTLALLAALGLSARPDTVVSVALVGVMLAVTAITVIAHRHIRISGNGSVPDAVVPISQMHMHEQLIREELIRVNRRLIAQLGRDELTGLHNRRALRAFIREVITVPGCGLRPLSIVMMDLDHFKRINDQHGHLAADRLLIVLAQAWMKGIRRSDLLARVGGDEFCLVLPDTTLAQADMVAHKLRAACSDAGRLWCAQEMQTGPDASLFRHGNADVQSISVSMGVANADHPSPDHIDNLMNLADKLLYEAKREGGGAVTVKRYAPPTPDA